MKYIENYYRRVLPEPQKLHTTVYFNKISFGWSQVIKLHCGENCLRIAAAELDLWSLIEEKKTVQVD